jgi:hypothetical protein
MTQGLVTLFSDRQFAGLSVPLDEGDTRFTADFNDSASSVRVAPGYCAVLYEHANEHGGYGAWVEFLEDCPDLSVYGFDKKTSYVRVFRTERDGFVWARGAMRDGQFVAGHWERQRARGGSALNSTVAVVAPPVPPPSAPLPGGGGVVVRDHRGQPQMPSPTSTIVVRAEGPMAQQARGLFAISLSGPDNRQLARGTARLDESGRCTFAKLPPGRYWLTIDTKADITWGATPSRVEIVCRPDSAEDVVIRFG